MSKVFQIAVSVNVRPKTVNLNNLRGSAAPNLASNPPRRRARMCKNTDIEAWMKRLARRAGQ